MADKTLTIQIAKQIAQSELDKIKDRESRDFHKAHEKAVVACSKLLAQSRKIDNEVLEIAGWLHDIGKSIENENHAQHSIEILEKQGYEISEILRDCILNHGTHDIPNTEEGKIIHIADKLSTINKDIVKILAKYSLKKDKESKDKDLEFIRKLANQGIDLLKQE